MKRKQIVRLPQAVDMTVADALVVVMQTVVVILALQRGIDPNEAYNEWEENKDGLLAVPTAVRAILDQHGDALNKMAFNAPNDLRMAGYKVEDLDLGGIGDDLPF